VIAPVHNLARGQSARLGPDTVALRPGDAVRVFVWREQDLSGEFPSDEDTVVTLPMLGRTRVSGLTAAALRDTLINRFSRDLKNPSVTVTPLRRLYVLGEVPRPGLYSVDPTVTLAGAIALAGGATANGNIEKLRLVRGGKTITGISAQESVGDIDVRSGDQVFVDRRSWFDRNNTFLVSSILSVTSIFISILRH
jgi:polysaccharide export outer membrane protein